MYFHRVKPYYFFLLLLGLTACSLNADQEAALSTATISYINARNEGVATAYVAFTYPKAVAYYTAQGDSVFQQRYDLSEVDSQPFLQDGNIETIEKNGEKIHVRYSFLSVDAYNYDIPSQEVYIIAISENNGVSWSYIDEEDYYNDAIVKPGDRLLKK